MNTQRKIVIEEYDPKWPELFEQEAIRVKQALGENCIEIYHIGSTAVPNLPAKPVIDLLPVVKDLKKVDEVESAMCSLGYEARGEYGIPNRRYFQKGGHNRTHHVHVFQEGNPEILRHLKFRDWLRTHPEDARRYAGLKKRLAKEHPHDIVAYTNGKEAFIANICHN